MKKVFPRYTWSIPSKEKIIYLTFDDGPHPQITPWVLRQLNLFNAKATFFCIGQNVVLHNKIYKQIIDEGHSVGNHTFHHLNGWKTSKEEYITDVEKAAAVIESNLFRPPYGRIRASCFQPIKNLLGANSKIVMWDILSADFDQYITEKQCLEFVLKNVHPGAVVVFHDSEKANRNMSFVLPRVLQYLTEKGYRFAAIPANGRSKNN